MNAVQVIAFALVGALALTLHLEQRARIRRDRRNEHSPP